MRVWVEGAWRGSEWIAFLLAEPLVAFLNCGRSSQVLGRLRVRVCMYLHLAACKSVNLLYVLCELESELLEEQNRACRMKKRRHAERLNSIIDLYIYEVKCLDGNLNFYKGSYFSNIKEVWLNAMKCWKVLVQTYRLRMVWSRQQNTWIASMFHFDSWDNVQVCVWWTALFLSYTHPLTHSLTEQTHLKYLILI